MKIQYILLLGCIFWFACASPQSNSDSSESPALPFETKHVEVLRLSPTAFNEIIELTGTVEAKHDVIVSSKTTGTLEAITALGQTVRIGQVIANTEDEMIRASVAQAEAQVNNAEAGLRIAEDSYTRQQPLFADSIISPLEFARLETTLEQARSALAQAEAVYEQVARQLDYTSIQAPIYGKVEARYIEPGEQVIPGTQVLRLVDARNVRIAAGVPERYAGDIEVGTLVEIRLPTAGISPRTGRVTFAGSVIDPASRSFEVNVEVENTDERLKPEMIAELAIVRLTIEDALVIPGNAVTRTENGLSIFVVENRDGNHVALSREVSLGAEYANQVVITSGLSANEQVVVRGQSTLANQDLVSIDQSFSGLDEYGVPIIIEDSSDSTPTPEIEL
ncbi:MAG: efflux RND transporter periplasmic adaptor subunit [Bacteroidota bacterium]|nr:efflux RND transporter periplasmic adaptor subunit [Bacteroidota bacterium]MXW14364.1 efflux RND transporter periplasmic adaptor subunit [Rhodothermaceae bacterium]MDE2644338.1 efflux RND transporter periplasmic adaptor subunit [Bacteroidota bacterium]MXW32802.1 efflux RND transporter periplasmic adaptor subunit [Rhodothermaceae bacterium]MXZ17092.1 efflux RND transporter periplasmic adaptor subunit [Rhodothermaceae bacterium]